MVTVVLDPLRSGEEDHNDDHTEHGIASCGSNAKAGRAVASRVRDIGVAGEWMV